MISFSIAPVASLGYEVSKERPCKASAEGGCFILLLDFDLSFVGVVLSDSNGLEAVGLPSDVAKTSRMSGDIRVTWLAPPSRLVCPSSVVSAVLPVFIAAKPISWSKGD